MNHNNTVMPILYKLGGYILLMTDNAKITVQSSNLDLLTIGVVFSAWTLFMRIMRGRGSSHN